MIRIGLLLIVAFSTPAVAEPVEPPQFAEELTSDVFATALDFMAPRILSPASIQQLTFWGLRGLTALDPALVPERGGGNVRLTRSGKNLFDASAPDPDDVDGWADTAAKMTKAAWTQSAALRRAGVQEVVTSFFDELFAELDAYSRYVPPAQAEIERAQRAGQADIGLTVVPGRGSLEIEEVVPDGPAAMAGLHPGDRIVAIDGRRIGWRDAAEPAKLLAGAEKTPVVLTVRGRNGAIREVSVPRAMLPPETVFAEQLGDMLVLRLTAFNGLTGGRVEHALARGLAGLRRPRGIVFDLRGNRGGPLHQAVEVAGTVLGTGLVATTVGRDPDANRVLQADATDLSGGLPVIVVVDGSSASAAEIVAAALADDRRAVVVGSATLGKGLIQTVTELPDGGELFVTWSRVLAPLGWPIQSLGVLPQVCTSLGDDELQRQLDRLARGEEPMEKALALNRTARPSLPLADILAIRNTCPAAEGRESDLIAARFLIHHPAAYVAALLPPQLLPASRAGPP